MYRIARFRNFTRIRTCSSITERLPSLRPNIRRYSECTRPHAVDNYKGVVFLLGWTGSTMKNLKKYSELYDGRGFYVIKYCTPYNQPFGLNPKKSLLADSEVLVREVLQRDLRHLPFYFHNLCNAGTCMYYTLLRRFQEEGYSDVKIAGTVFDSSPAPYTSTMVYNSTYSVAPGNKVTKTALGLITIPFMNFVFWINTARAYAKGMRMDIEQYRYYVPQQLAELPNQEAQHFMYSEADKIISARGIEWFIAERRKIGVRVSLTKWKDSSHVKHILKYPDEYRSSLDKFLDYCEDTTQKN